MAAGALSLSNGFSLVSLGGAQPSGWHALFELPGSLSHVACDARTRSERNLLAARLDAAVTSADRPVLLLGEGAGCFAAAWWARLSPAAYVSRVAGGLFFRPAQDEEGDAFASPRIRLPFPSIVFEGDPAASPQLAAIAQGWGSGLAADPGADGGRLLQRTRAAVERFTAAIVERDVQAARRRLNAETRWR